MINSLPAPVAPVPTTNVNEPTFQTAPVATVTIAPPTPLPRLIVPALATPVTGANRLVPPSIFQLPLRLNVPFDGAAYWKAT